MADNVLTRANSIPNSAAVKINISGSIIGEAIQNANTGAMGTPAASSPATKGITPQEQKGESAPNIEATAIALTGLPWKALATI